MIPKLVNAKNCFLLATNTISKEHKAELYNAVTKAASEGKVRISVYGNYSDLDYAFLKACGFTVSLTDHLGEKHLIIEWENPNDGWLALSKGS